MSALKYSVQAVRPIMIAAGGTGGHVFPALAVAELLREQSCSVVWLGTKKGIEARVVPENGFLIHYLNVVGLRGKGLIYWVKAPVLMLFAVFVAIKLILRIRPACVLAMGGFASAAAGLAAFLTRTPLLLHEQNSVFGTTNKLLTPLATKVFMGFPDVVSGSEKFVFSGNPLRRPFYSKPEPAERYSDANGNLRIVVVGGSLGAQFLNETVPAAIRLVVRQIQSLEAGHELFDQHIDVLHQTGSGEVDNVIARYQAENIAASVSSFITDLSQCYADADLVIARSGALTVAELAAVGVASILVPYPHAIDDHQSSNADWLVSVGSADKVDQRSLSVDALGELLFKRLSDRAQLLDQAKRARAIATPAAAKMIAAECKEYADV